MISTSHGKRPRAEMGGILLKWHQTSTVERTYLVSRVVPGISICGGIVLNETVGGLNRAAVHVALLLAQNRYACPRAQPRTNGDTKADLAASQSLIAPDGFCLKLSKS